MKKKNKTFKAYEKILREDQDWDSNYLLALEKKKLERMYNYFSKSSISEDDAKSAREIALCLRLLDILQEIDPVSKEFLRRTSESLPKNLNDLWEDIGINGVRVQKLKENRQAKVAMFPIYVNYKNEFRFYDGRRKPIQEILEDSFYTGEEIRRTQCIQYHLESLRHLKALYLYNKIRAYRMMDWWN